MKNRETLGCLLRLVRFLILTGGLAGFSAEGQAGTGQAWSMPADHPKILATSGSPNEKASSGGGSQRRRITSPSSTEPLQSQAVGTRPTASIHDDTQGELP